MIHHDAENEVGGVKGLGGRGRWRRLGGQDVAILSIALFILALAVRWWALPSQASAMYGDEAQLMIEARKFITGVYTTPFTVDSLSLPAVYDYLLSIPLRLAGSMDVTIARGFSGVLGALSVPLLYLTARVLGYSRWLGLIAAIVLATTFWDVHFSRLALQNIMAVSATSVSVLFTVMAVRRASLLAAALAGAGLAWAVAAYLSGVMVALVLVGWLAFLIAMHSQWSAADLPRPGNPQPVARGVLRRALGWGAGDARKPVDLNSPAVRVPVRVYLAVGVVLGLVALVCAWPVLQLYLSPGSPLSAHVSERYILTPSNRAAFAALHPDVGSGTWSILWYQLKATAGMFTVSGDPDPTFNQPGRPMLDALSGLLLAVGVGSALWTWRRPASALALLWLVVPLILGTTLTTGTTPGVDGPSTTRSLPALPALCLLIALGLDVVLAAAGWLLQLAQRQMHPPAWWPAARLVATIVATGTIGVSGIARYWDFVDAPVHHERFYDAAHEWATHFAPLDGVPVTVVGPAGWPGEFITLYAPHAMVCAGRWVSTWSVCPPARLVIFDGDALDARRYTTITGIQVYPGPSEDQITRYWYARGDHLPDPAHVLAGIAS